MTAIDDRLTRPGRLPASRLAVLAFPQWDARSRPVRVAAAVRLDLFGRPRLGGGRYAPG